MRPYLGMLFLAAGLSAACAVGFADEKKAEGGAEGDASAEVKSGPQKGDPFAGAFNVKGVTGDVAGQTLCFT